MNLTLDRRLLPKAFLALAALGVFVWIGYLLTQQPKLSLNSQQFGLMLLKGGYRSWFLSFSDGTVPTFPAVTAGDIVHVPDPKPPPPPPPPSAPSTLVVSNLVVSNLYVTNIYVSTSYVTNVYASSPQPETVWRSVVLSKDGLSFRLGYRLIPKFTHTDMRKKP